MAAKARQQALLELWETAEEAALWLAYIKTRYERAAAPLTKESEAALR